MITALCVFLPMGVSGLVLGVSIDRWEWRCLISLARVAPAAKNRSGERGVLSVCFQRLMTGSRKGPEDSVVPPHISTKGSYVEVISR